MNRFIDADQELLAIFNEVLAEDFFNLGVLKFKLVFDNKKRMSKGNLVLSSTELVNEKMKFFTSDDEAPEGYDYIIFFDAVAWEYASEADRKRLISHELNHVFIDEKGKLKVVGHDVEDFAHEIKKNADNPYWALDLATLALAVYDQNEEL